MTAEEVENKYQAMGLVTERVDDPPGKVYEKHSHNRTYLYTLEGSVEITLDGDRKVSTAVGEEVVIETGQLHEAIVGQDGWKYVAAWDAEEEAKYGVEH